MLLAGHRLDHADIYPIIVGTYTPLALLTLDGDGRVAVLAVVWTGGRRRGCVPGRVAARAALLSTSLYIVLGWTEVLVLR